MVVVISDLHLCDETVGKHNVNPEEVQMVFKDLAASPFEPEEIVLVLLGDIFDINRSTLWMEVPEAERPWGADRNKAEAHASDVLEGIIERNAGVLEALRELRSFFGHIRGKVETVYVPGNHDRLCSLFPSLRTRVRLVLGIEGGEEGFLPFYDNERYGIFATHGHECDVFNFEGALEAAPIGDLITAEFIVRLPPTIMGHVEGMELSSEEKEHLRRNLQEIDDVRPYSAIFDWLLYQVKANARLRKSIEVAAEELASHFETLTYVQEWYSKHDRWGFDEADKIQLIPRVLTSLRLDVASSLARFASKILAPFRLPSLESVEEALLRAAEQFLQTHPSYEFYVAGHTHNPCSVPVGMGSGRGELYVNTGTWRRRHMKARDGSFVSVKSISYAAFYSRDEAWGPRFEMWTGSLKD